MAHEEFKVAFKMAQFRHSKISFHQEKQKTDEDVPKKIKSKFDEYRTTVGDDNSFRKKFRNAVNDYKKGSEKSVRIRLVIILSILVSLFLLFFFI